MVSTLTAKAFNTTFNEMITLLFLNYFLFSKYFLQYKWRRILNDTAVFLRLRYKPTVTNLRADTKQAPELDIGA